MRQNVRIGRGIALMTVVSAILVMMLMSIPSCSMMGGDVKSYKDMSPEERATYLMSVYNDQYELYLREAKIPDMTEEKKEVLRTKKELMTELYPYIGLYANYAEQGVFAPPDVEMAAMEIMNKLLGL